MHSLCSSIRIRFLGTPMKTRQLACLVMRNLILIMLIAVFNAIGAVRAHSAPFLFGWVLSAPFDYRLAPFQYFPGAVWVVYHKIY